MAKRFNGASFKDGLLMIDDLGGPKQAISYTREGDVLKFSLAGQEGAVYSVAKGEEDYDDLAKGFKDAGIEFPEETKKAPVRSDARPPAAASTGSSAS